MYYVEGPGGRWIAFASETKALVGAGLASSEVDRRALAGFLLLGSIPAPRTLRRRIACLPAGHFMVLARGANRSPDATGTSRKRWLTSRERQRGGKLPELAETLQDAVSSHLISDAPLGVFLSGGMDSAAIAALASRVHAGPLRTVTITFGEGAFNEAAQAREASEAFGTEHHELRVT